jgi:hypothetical protein
VALAGSEKHAHYSEFLAIAVLLHRLPAGLAIWWLVRPRLGRRSALLVLSALAAATIAGFTGSLLGWPDMFSGTPWFITQALLAGSLVHIVLHQSLGPASPKHHSVWQLASLSGAILGVTALWVTEHLQESHDHHSHLGEVFLGLATLCAFPMLLTYLVTFLLHGFFPAASKMLGRFRSGVTGGLQGAFLGTLFNPCSCANSERLSERVAGGYSTSAALSYSVVAPVSGLGALFMSIPLLGFTGGAIRIAIALFVVFLLGGLLGRTRHRRQAAGVSLMVHHHEHHHQSLEGGRWLQAFRAGWVEAPLQTLPWLMVGLGLAALVAELLPVTVFQNLPDVYHVPLATVASVFTYICAAGSTPVVAVLISKGLTWGAGLVILVAGPVANRRTYSLIARHLGRTTARLVVAAVLVAANLMGWLVDWLVDLEREFAFSHLHDGHEVGEWILLGLFALLLLVTIARSGVPNFLSVVLALHGHTHHEPDRDKDQRGQEIQ